MATSFPQVGPAPVPFSAHSSHYARRFHELLVPLESLVTEWNGGELELRCNYSPEMKS